MVLEEEKVLGSVAATPLTPGEAALAEVRAKGRKKVAILGFTDTWKEAPFDDPEFEIWGLNELYLFISQHPGGRWDRWFEIHSRTVYEADKKRTNEHVENLKKLTCPIYMHQRWDDIPCSVPYPLQAVAEAFPNPSPGWKPYLTNTISYQIALAIIEGFEEIQVFGVDMAHDCLAPDMRVLTADLQWVPAGELVAGQELMGFEEEPGNGSLARRYQRTTVKSLSRITRPCRRLTMSDGRILVASVGHQWLTERQDEIGWTKTIDALPHGNSCQMAATRIVRVGEYGGPVLGAALNYGDTVGVLGIEDIGAQEVVGITTTTGTLIVEGFASHNSEYGSQRPSCEYYLGIAFGRGIKIYLPPTADLMKTVFLYGYEQLEAEGFDRKLKARKQELQRKFDELTNQLNQTEAARQQYAGALQDNDHMVKNWRSLHT